ncbi:MAG TPA: D-2-hydroxyacid dehydrogenase [Terriglobales bacterium]
MKGLIVHFNSFELWHAPAWINERLRDDFPEHQFVQLESNDRVSREIEDTAVFVGAFLSLPDFKRAAKLQWIHSPTAAVHQLMFPELVRSSVRVTNSTGIHGPVVAEHALAMILALAKRLPQAMRYQVKKKWAQDKVWHERPHPREVAGTTVAVVGMGGIGNEFTQRAKALGLRVLAVRENAGKGTNGADEVYTAAQIDDVLPQADFVLLCAPLTPATRGIINAARLRKMKRDAYLINVSRGPLIVEVDLIDALKNKRIGGAALDVFIQEPLPRGSAFWRLDNVLITPHTASFTEQLWERHYQHIVENMKRFLAGQPLLNEVDKQRGY